MNIYKFVFKLNLKFYINSQIEHKDSFCAIKILNLGSYIRF